MQEMSQTSDDLIFATRKGTYSAEQWRSHWRQGEE